VQATLEHVRCHRWNIDDEGGTGRDFMTRVAQLKP